MDVDPALSLPPNIQQVLRRKSSRDPNSRFVNKLHTLLTFVTNSEGYENTIGLAWVNDTQFRMNKRTLGAIMGIKVNTLNVNLRDLKFVSKQRDRDGWTVWEREGFTKHELIPMSIDSKGLGTTETKATVLSQKAIMQNPNMFGYPTGPIVQSQPNPNNFNCFVHPQSIGKCSPEEISQFNESCLIEWNEIFPGHPAQSTFPAAFFVEHCAEHFRQAEQPRENAIQVIDAIINPSSKSMHLTFHDLTKLLAMFGPRPTIMMKIAHLLTCSNESGQWLQFDQRCQSSSDRLVGYFDDMEPNCLILKGEGRVSRIYNNPVTNADGNYLKDENGTEYPSWSEYFKMNPIDFPRIFPGD